ncbi:Aste57867_18271 [Aphanomyces stellatus]|uniref:Aste57867_18271 protein n=1 Tax=Aphanomyces stellatus TaxID=120398 RepID=A0A485L9N0_9STRA|nr:hypothetical protein As57867_018209 [Aphanomyces stellatus]VFT95008.1 Aste57867_18271 [Aphanomyces stellatus]
MMNRTKKRKKTQVGLGASEIAFIEDEIAAVAMEYGLEMDDDVAKSIQVRQAASKKHKKALPAGVATKAPSATPALDSKALQALLPKQCSIGPCKSPGCNCRAFIHDKKGKSDDCHKCDHGQFLHSIVFNIDSDDESKAIHGQVLLGMMYSLVVLGRLASTVVGSNAWTQASLELLQTSVQLYLKKQLVRAAEQQKQDGDDDATDVDRPLMARLSTELASLIVTATQAVAASGRTQMRIKLACIFDQMYFCLYHTAVGVFGRACAAVPAPDEYLVQIDKHRPSSQSDYDMFVATMVDGQDIPEDFHSAAYNVKPKQGIALLDLFLARQREGVQLFYEPGMGMNGEMDKVVADLGRKQKESAKKLTKKQRMNLNKGDAIKTKTVALLPAYPLLELWRDTCKTPCDAVYAKAIPHPTAIKTIAKYGPIVEMGAGNGYWQSVLQASKVKVDVVAFDPAATAKWAANDDDDENGDDDDDDVAQSGGPPSWSTVYEGAADVLGNAALKGRTLLLCTPPPTSFARDCLRHYKGKTLLHVGEWHGTTGDRQFECDVMKSFDLKERVALPNWGDTAYELTVWTRRTKANAADVLPPVACAMCESTHQSLLKRCLLCKTMVYCSADCMAQHEAVHTAEHARRLVFLDKAALDFDNVHHFHEFEWDMDANADFKVSTTWKDAAGETTTKKKATTASDKDAGFAFKF